MGIPGEDKTRFPTSCQRWEKMWNMKVRWTVKKIMPNILVNPRKFIDAQIKKREEPDIRKLGKLIWRINLQKKCRCDSCVREGPPCYTLSNPSLSFEVKQIGAQSTQAKNLHQIRRFGWKGLGAIFWSNKFAVKLLGSTFQVKIIWAHNFGQNFKGKKYSELYKFQFHTNANSWTGRKLDALARVLLQLHQHGAEHMNQMQCDQFEQIQMFASTNQEVCDVKVKWRIIKGQTVKEEVTNLLSCPSSSHVVSSIKKQ